MCPPPLDPYLHGPMDYTKKLKLRVCVGDLDLPERRKRYRLYRLYSSSHSSSRDEEDMDADMCPCGTTIESMTHI